MSVNEAEYQIFAGIFLVYVAIGSIHKFTFYCACLFVHELPYQNYNSVLHAFGSSYMDHCTTTFHVRVELAQGHPNNTVT